ncbi:glutaredoxin family protein [Roseateles sp. SL47]|uniref:glutaredoxin family protein n=1 Tax=Roseateles sp. SL47 TaxID=2995138 RepID=UPI002270E64E|nr:glutaredoxin family protein [Roseateles sp. SL47]WAC74734.1 glutaredoxin family protein [Roseateles sp. SL47]
MQFRSGSRTSRLIVEALLCLLIVAIAIPAGKFTAYAWNDFRQRAVQGNFSSYFSGKDLKISVYGTESCPACQRARAILNEQGISFNDLRIDQNSSARSEWKALGQDSFPVFLTAGHRLTGFQEARLLAMLQDEGFSLDSSKRHQ